MFQIYNRRYLGSKKRLIDFIKSIVKNNTKNSKSFADLFGGTGVVAYSMLDDMDVTVNDLLKSNVTAFNAFMGDEKVNIKKVQSILNEFNKNNSYKKGYYFRTFKGTYLSDANLMKLDYVREKIDVLFNEKEINQREKDVLLTSLIYAIDKSANTVGHYDAYIKNDNHVKKNDVMFLETPNINKKVKNKVRIYNSDANELANKISADIVYLDPPYNSRQYSDAYHFLENVINNEHPKVFGIAKKMNRENIKSKYSQAEATEAFRDLIRKLDCRYIMLSYNNTGNKGNARSNAKLADSDILDILSRKGDTKIFEKEFPMYSTGKTPARKNHKERIFFCEVGTFKSKNKLKKEDDISSPLNYTGGKFKLIKQIKKILPNNVDVFYDIFCGGFNIGCNIKANKIIGIDSSPQLIDLLNFIKNTDTDKLMDLVDRTISEYGLSDTWRHDYAYYGVDSGSGLTSVNKKNFKAVKQKYNECKDSLLLLVLIIYSFNNIIRFNSIGEFNAPVGKRDFNSKMRTKLRDFSNRIKTQNTQFINCDFDVIKNIQFNNNDFVYLDPPYLLGEATYNTSWNLEQERKLYKSLDILNKKGINFALSNVIRHKGMTNSILQEWVKKNHLKVHSMKINYKNSSYNVKNKKDVTEEVVVTNY